MASVHPGELFVLVHGDVNETIGPDTFGHLRCFVMAGIAGQDEIRGARVLQELGTMKFLQRCQIRQPWTDRLASTGKASHEVRLDLTRQNLDVSIEAVCINIYVSTTRSAGDKTQRRGISSAVIYNRIPLYHIGAKHDDFLSRSAGAMRPGCH